MTAALCEARSVANHRLGELASLPGDPGPRARYLYEPSPVDLSLSAPVGNLRVPTLRGSESYAPASTLPTGSDDRPRSVCEEKTFKVAAPPLDFGCDNIVK